MIRGILQAFSADLAGQQTSGDTGPGAADIAACAKRAVEEFSPAFAEKGIRLLVDPSVDLTRDWFVAGDDSRLDRIFGNLLENALRYSPKETSVTIGLEDRGKAVIAFVDDQGPGLPKDQPADKMFALFAKGSDKPGKAGLGLYFCKITVERWGGTIGAETKPTGGTRFWFRLPRATKPARDIGKKESSRDQGAPGDAPKTSAPAARPHLDKPAKRLRILVAEDTNENRELVSELLRKRGHTVVGVADGRQAVEALAKDQFDAVLMDEQMPVMDGLEATRAIRQGEKSSGKRQVIIALTGNVTDEDKERRVKAGMDGFVPKPFEMNALFDTIEFLATFGNQVIGAKAGAPRQTTGTERAVAPAEPSIQLAGPSEDVATHLRRTTGGSEKLIQTLTKSFLADAPKRLAAIRSAIAAKDPAKLDTAAHAFKGSLSIFGAQKAVGAARALEAMGRGRNLNGADAEFRALETEFKDLEKQLLAMGLRKKLPAKKRAARGKK
jgi:CheY-like chemotaxis protein